MPTLTDTKIRTAKAEAKPYSLQDGSGLYLEVRPSGAKYWRYRYWLTPENVACPPVYVPSSFPSCRLKLLVPFSDFHFWDLARQDKGF